MGSHGRAQARVEGSTITMMSCPGRHFGVSAICHVNVIVARRRNDEYRHLCDGFCESGGGITFPCVALAK